MAQILSMVFQPNRPVGRISRMTTMITNGNTPATPPSKTGSRKKGPGRGDADDQAAEHDAANRLQARQQCHRQRGEADVGCEESHAFAVEKDDGSEVESRPLSPMRSQWSA